MPRVPAYKEGNIEFIEFDKIQVEPKEVGNRPIDKEHVVMLSESIRKNGLLQPLVVWNGGEKERARVNIEVDGKEITVPTAIVVAGFHRMRAIRRLKNNDEAAYNSVFPNGVPCVVRSGTLQDVLADQLRENLERKGIEASDALRIMIRLRDEFKMKPSAIARHIGKSEAYVSEIFGIEKTLGKEGVDAVQSKAVILNDAIKASKKVKAAQKAGKSVDPKAELESAKEKRKKLNEKGSKRAEKKVGAKTLYKNYQKLPRTSTGNKLMILEAAFGYLAGESDTPPSELVGESSGD